MATAGRVKAGLTIRNLARAEIRDRRGRHAPDPRTAGAGRDCGVAGRRLARRGGSGPPHDRRFHGEVRDFAIGAEGKVAGRAFVRAGARMNTFETETTGRIPTAGFGGSYAVTPSVLVDAQLTVGSSQAPRGWGISARFVYRPKHHSPWTKPSGRSVRAPRHLDNFCPRATISVSPSHVFASSATLPAALSDPESERWPSALASSCSRKSASRLPSCRKR